MTLEPSMLAVEQRLQRLASEMPSPDVEAGWAALSAMLEPPLAPVIPLRRRSFGRPIALAAAAALLVAGSAFAAVTRGDPQTRHVAPLIPVELPGIAFSGPHLHAPFSGPPAVPTKTPDKPERPPKDATVDTPSTGGTSGGGSTTTDGSGATSDHTKAQDDPNDLDQGTGNDGQHNDHGGGNNGSEDSQARGQGNGQDH